MRMKTSALGLEPARVPAEHAGLHPHRRAAVRDRRAAHRLLGGGALFLRHVRERGRDLRALRLGLSGHLSAAHPEGLARRTGPAAAGGGGVHHGLVRDARHRVAGRRPRAAPDAPGRQPFPRARPHHLSHLRRYRGHARVAGADPEAAYPQAQGRQGLGPAGGATARQDGARQGGDRRHRHRGRKRRHPERPGRAHPRRIRRENHALGARRPGAASLGRRRRAASAGCRGEGGAAGAHPAVAGKPGERRGAARYGGRPRLSGVAHLAPGGGLMVRLVLLSLLALAALPCTAQYPGKPIRIVIPFVAGGSSDIVGRAIGSKFQEFLHQPAVVENRPGANGAIAAELVAKSDADGYTILVGSIGVFSINAALFKDLRYQPLRDFAPITLAVTTPNVLIAKPALPPDSVKELVELAKKNPGRLAYCSSGSGSSDHLTGEGFRQSPDFPPIPVPYKGVPPFPTDTLGNQVDFSFQNLGAVTNYIKAGRMKALVVTAKSRHPQLPSVPSAAEAGYPDLVVTSWQAVAAPAKTPREVVAKLNDAVVRALHSPQIRERMTQIGFDVVAGAPEGFCALMKAEIERWDAGVGRGRVKTGFNGGDP